MFTPESLKTKVEPDDPIESACEYAARFLNEKERTEIFELLYSSLADNSKLSPEKQVAKIIGVTTQIVYDWKRKTKIPGQKNSARIMAELLRAGLQQSNPRIKAIFEKVGREMFQSYILFLDKDLYNFYELQYDYVRKATLKYLPSLFIILLYDVGFEKPNYASPRYHGQPLGRIIYPNSKAQMLNALPSFNESKEMLQKLLERAQKRYDEFNIV